MLDWREKVGHSMSQIWAAQMAHTSMTGKSRLERVHLFRLAVALPSVRTSTFSILHVCDHIFPNLWFTTHICALIYAVGDDHLAAFKFSVVEVEVQTEVDSQDLTEEKEQLTEWNKIMSVSNIQVAARTLIVFGTIMYILSVTSLIGSRVYLLSIEAVCMHIYSLLCMFSSSFPWVVCVILGCLQLINWYI